MWKHLRVFFICTLFCGVLSDLCITPLGSASKCISLYECPELVAVLKQTPIPKNVFDFVAMSKCGFQNNIPKVCCGPVPDKKSVKKLMYSIEDSYPAPRGQCGVDRDGDRIYGGEDADLSEFPWMALLGYKNSIGEMSYECGGSLINLRYVLTAAHCIIGYDQNAGPLTSVRLGEHDKSADGQMDCPYGICSSRIQEIGVDFALAHPGYDPKVRSKTHDIGIVRLAKRATYTYYVQPICLSASAKFPNASESGIVSGWGKTLAGYRSPVKRKVTLSIYDKHKCAERFLPKNVSLEDTQFCAGGTYGQDACKGDSGGPMIMKSSDGKWEVVGIVSFGWGCGQEGWPGVYTSVAGYLSWIKSTLQTTDH